MIKYPSSLSLSSSVSLNNSKTSYTGSKLDFTNFTQKKNHTMSGELCDDVVRHILNAHSSGYNPTEIHAQLIARGYRRLSLLAVKQCLRFNGYAIDNDNTTNTSQLSTHVEPAMIKPWDVEADKYAFEAYFLGKSVFQIWVQLRGKGYAVTQVQVVTSLNTQGVQSVEITE